MGVAEDKVQELEGEVDAQYDQRVEETTAHPQAANGPRHPRLNQAAVNPHAPAVKHKNPLLQTDSPKVATNIPIAHSVD